jgi:hypothetical protein
LPKLLDEIGPVGNQAAVTATHSAFRWAT